MKASDYVNKFIEPARQVQEKYGVPVAVSLVQSFLESGAGESALAKDHNNYFGITAGSWKGKTAVFKDWYIDKKTGQKVYYDIAFRSYPSIEAGWLDYGNLLKNGKYYKDAFDFVNDPVMFISKLVDESGPKYAQDPNYVKKFSAALQQLKPYIPADIPPPIYASGGGGLIGIVLLIGAAVAMFVKR